MQLGRDRRGVLRDDAFVAEARDVFHFHLFVRRAVGQRRADLYDMTRRQLVLILARFQHVCGRANALHHLFKRAAGRCPLAEVAVDADEILLKEGTLGSAQQPLVDDLALAEDIFQPVRRERSGQPPAHLDRGQQLFQSLEALAAGVLQPRQFVEHDPVEAR